MIFSATNNSRRTLCQTYNNLNSIRINTSIINNIDGKTALSVHGTDTVQVRNTLTALYPKSDFSVTTIKGFRYLN